MNHSSPRFAVSLLMVTLGIWSCATVDFDYPKRESYVLVDTADTDLGRFASRLPATAPDVGDFYLLVDGVEALAARLGLAARAERSIDAQYYLVNSDLAGLLFVNALYGAAERGVRVRLLLDDIQTRGLDQTLATLDSHPNFEVRIFNPFPRNRLRMLGSVSSFRRVNRRMHNKSFTVDNQGTVIGGRNIGSEYFSAREDVNFGDLDVLGFGPVVSEVSTMFDTYWNDRIAVPIRALTGEPENVSARQTQLRERLDRALEQAAQTPYAAALESTLLDRTCEGDLLVRSPYQLVYDPPEKGRTDWDQEAPSILGPLREAILGAEESFLIVSPYFVPMKNGVRTLRELEDRGVEVEVVTNSLAANNHSFVHAGYANYRLELLKAGVDLYEVRPDIRLVGTEWTGEESTGATLHAKAFIVDRENFFIGSFNMDPRSAHINTEMGILLRSPELAGQNVDGVHEALPTRTYRVTRKGKNSLLWTTQNPDGEFVYTQDPEVSCFKRFGVLLMRLLPIDRQL